MSGYVIIIERADDEMHRELQVNPALQCAADRGIQVAEQTGT